MTIDVDTERFEPDEPAKASPVLESLLALVDNWKKLVGLPLAAGAVTAGVMLLTPPTYTARTSFLPPQTQPSNGASAALASLGALSGLAGAVGGTSLRSPADQYVSLMQSVTLSDRIIDRFKLIEIYGEKLRMRTRKALAARVQITVGKRDNLVSVEVDDQDPERAAAMANGYVEELRRFAAQLALTEAQQRRQFFEQQLGQSKQKLTQAQQALLGSGYGENTLKAEPKAAADGYARLRAELTSAEVRLQALRSQLRDQAPEVEQQAAAVAALRASLANLQRSDSASGGPDYVSKYREFKYQETLFEMFSRQYELARVDESREGVAIQVVDTALPPEFKSKPSRLLNTLGALLAAFVLTATWIVGRSAWQRFAADPINAKGFAQWRAARSRG